MTAFDALMGGFGVVLGVELVLTVSNVVSSYILPEGSTLEEWLDSKLNMGASQ